MRNTIKLAVTIICLMAIAVIAVTKEARENFLRRNQIEYYSDPIPEKKPLPGTAAFEYSLCSMTNNPRRDRQCRKSAERLYRNDTLAADGNRA